MIDLFEFKPVIEDLLYLKRNWYNKLDEGELRRGTAIFRRLLIEGEYGNLWRRLGFPKEPSVLCVDLDYLLPCFDGSHIVYAFAGGVKIEGLHLTTMVLHEGDESAAFSEEKANNCIRSMPLSKYLSSTTAVIGDNKITRQEYIMFVANKKGGVHLKKNKEILSEKFESIKKLEGKVVVELLDGFYREIQSVGQAITDSDDCQKLLSAFNQLI
ncbi:MAG: hypothetical protein AMXMBFR49_27220 [Chlorobiota bacterium]